MSCACSISKLRTHCDYIVSELYYFYLVLFAQGYPNVEYHLIVPQARLSGSVRERRRQNLINYYWSLSTPARRSRWRAASDFLGGGRCWNGKCSVHRRAVGRTESVRRERRAGEWAKRGWGWRRRMGLGGARYVHERAIAGTRTRYPAYSVGFGGSASHSIESSNELNPSLFK